MRTLSTHVLDAVSGSPAAGVRVVLSRRDGRRLDRAARRRRTDADGRVRELAPPGWPPGDHRLVFDTGGVVRGHRHDRLLPGGRDHLHRRPTERHLHVPLLLSPYAFSTYRGS